MKVTINLEVECKLQLLCELQNVLDKLTKTDTIDAVREFKHGKVTVESDGEFSKFAVVDSKDEYISFHNDKDSADAAAWAYDYSVIELN